MKRYFLIYLSFLLLPFIGVEPACASGIIAQNGIEVLHTASAPLTNHFDIHHEAPKLNGANKCQEQLGTFLFEVEEEDDERVSKIPSTVLPSLIKASELKGRQATEETESYPISSNSLFFYSTERYISFCSIRV